MAKDWEYAQMAKTASEAGGPDAWIETIKDAAYYNGASDMKNKLSLPLLLTGIGLGTAGVIGYQKIKNWIVERKAKKLITKQEAIRACSHKKSIKNHSEINNGNKNRIKFVIAGKNFSETF